MALGDWFLNGFDLLHFHHAKGKVPNVREKSLVNHWGLSADLLVHFPNTNVRLWEEVLRERTHNGLVEIIEDHGLEEKSVSGLMMSKDERQKPTNQLLK